jgi:hypothetical protein
LFGIAKLMALAIKNFIGFGDESREADAADGASAGILELADLIGDIGLAGARGGGVESKYVIEEAYDGLHPFSFATAEFIHFHTERRLFAIVHFFHELGKFTDFAAHALGDLFGGDGSFFSAGADGFMDDGPLVAGGANLGGELVEVFNFFRDGAEGIHFDHFAHGFVIKVKGQDGDDGAERH